MVKVFSYEVTQRLHDVLGLWEAVDNFVVSGNQQTAYRHTLPSPQWKIQSVSNCSNKIASVEWNVHFLIVMTLCYIQYDAFTNTVR